jgi:hypothetical protein
LTLSPSQHPPVRYPTVVALRRAKQAPRHAALLRAWGNHIRGNTVVRLRRSPTAHVSERAWRSPSWIAGDYLARVRSSMLGGGADHVSYAIAEARRPAHEQCILGGTDVRGSRNIGTSSRESTACAPTLGGRNYPELCVSLATSTATAKPRALVSVREELNPLSCGSRMAA